MHAHVFYTLRDLIKSQPMLTHDLYDSRILI